MLIGRVGAGFDYIDWRILLVDYSGEFYNIRLLFFWAGLNRGTGWFEEFEPDLIVGLVDLNSLNQKCRVWVGLKIVELVD